MVEFYYGHYVWSKHAAVCPTLLSAGWGGGPCPQRRKPHNSRAWVIDYNYLSYGLYRGGGPAAAWLPRQPYVLHLYPPHLTFWEDTRTVEGDYRSAWIFFEGGDEIGLDAYTSTSHGYAVFEDPADRLGRLLERIGQVAIQYGESSYWQCQALFCGLIGLLGQAYRVNELTYRLDAEGVMPPPTLTAQLEELLAANLAEPLSIEEITSHLAMSKSALYKQLRTETNETITQISMRLRIAEAKQLLLKDYPLKEIATRTGFCNSFYLSSTFKRLEGVSPKEFRKMMK